MFSGLTERLSQSIRKLSGQHALSEENIQGALREVRMALLEADTALPVVKTFIERVQEKAVGQTVIGKTTPGQTLVKIVHEELVHLLGISNEHLDLKTAPPAVILMAGLQGSGKTTTTAKLALSLIEREKKSVLVTSCDIYRPAAINQLETVANQAGAQFFPSTTTQNPVTIAQNAIEAAKKSGADVVIIDTAGRLHIDDAMMTEIKAIHAAVNPIETLFVVDSMTGQDAANTAKAFHDALPLTGIILTKTDGDARGGAALSIREITGKPIKFMGVGEKITALDPFHPDRLASRILGMGDVLSLIEDASRTIDQEEAEKAQKKLKKGQFDLDDFRSQLLQMKKMGGVGQLMDKLPGMSAMGGMMPSQDAGDKELKKLQAIIDSMTKQERRFPAIIKGSRKRRIAKGSGTEVQDVNKLLKQFTQMQKMFKKMSKKGGMRKMMSQVQQMMGGAGGLPKF